MHVECVSDYMRSPPASAPALALAPGHASAPASAVAPLFLLPSLSSPLASLRFDLHLDLKMTSPLAPLWLLSGLLCPLAVPLWLP